MAAHGDHLDGILLAIAKAFWNEVLKGTFCPDRSSPPPHAGEAFRQAFLLPRLSLPPGYSSWFYPVILWQSWEPGHEYMTLQSLNLFLALYHFALVQGPPARLAVIGQMIAVTPYLLIVSTTTASLVLTAADCIARVLWTTSYSKGLLA